MKSLKGVVFGSPEYVRIVKAAEYEAENTKSIDEAVESIERIIRNSAVLTIEQQERLRRVQRNIIGILDEGW